MFVELHIIQNFAPSNLNRDDTGNPKETEFGGVRRARISSQCIKRAIRTHPVFAQETGVTTAIRSRWLTRLLTERLQAKNFDPDEIDTVVRAFVEAYIRKPEDDGHTSVLLFLSQEEIDRFAQALLDNWDVVRTGSDKEVQAALKSIVNDLEKATKNRTSAPDIALFGRMLAENPKLNLDAACQVAHALSTHRVSMEMDFFTAVDDLRESDETGAGMMGYTGFNSATYYRYARIDWDQLKTNLDGDHELARRTVKGFLRAAVAAIPTGKQNTFAAQNPPSFVLGVVRHDGQSWSLVNAFERPVYASRNRGLVAASLEALDRYWGNLTSIYGNDLAAVAAVNLESDVVDLPHLNQHERANIDVWAEALLAPLAQEPVQ